MGQADSFAAPALIAHAGAAAQKKFFEFFTVPIRNAHTRAAYYRAVQQFLTWVEQAGYQHLEDIEPIRPLYRDFAAPGRDPDNVFMLSKKPPKFK